MLTTYIHRPKKAKSLSNIYIGNLDRDELEEAPGNRLASRVWNDSIPVKFVGADRRGINNGYLTDNK